MDSFHICRQIMLVRYIGFLIGLSTYLDPFRIFESLEQQSVTWFSVVHLLKCMETCELLQHALRGVCNSNCAVQAPHLFVLYVCTVTNSAEKRLKRKGKTYCWILFEFLWDFSFLKFILSVLFQRMMLHSEPETVGIQKTTTVTTTTGQ